MSAQERGPRHPRPPSPARKGDIARARVALARADFNARDFEALEHLWVVAETQLEQGPTLVRIAGQIARAQSHFGVVKPSPDWDARAASRAIVHVLTELEALISDYHDYINVFARGAWTTVIEDLCELLRVSMGTAPSAHGFEAAAKPDIEADDRGRVQIGYEIPPDRIRRIVDGLESIRVPFESLSRIYAEQRRSRDANASRRDRPGPHVDVRRDVLFVELKRRGVSDRDVAPVAAAFCLLRGKDRSSWQSLLQKLRVAYRRFRERAADV